MKVADVMSTRIHYVSDRATVKDVARIIFGRGINGVPVVKDRKVIGYITERDILSRFFPTVQEYMEDPVNTSNFEEMEKKVAEILSLRADRIMSKNITTVTPETPILRAQSLMTVNKIGRLPVVDEKKNLIGIIVKKDIFKAVVGNQMPYFEEEEYHDWIAKYYDVATDWSQRLNPEVDSLASLFKKNKVKKFLDIGCGTGEHAISLAKKGFDVIGLESSQLMYRAAYLKWKKLPKSLQKKVRFVSGDYILGLQTIDDGSFDAAIFMGNAFAHHPKKYKGILTELKRVLRSKSLIVAQLLNAKKIIDQDQRLVDFEIKPTSELKSHEQAFLWFYDPPRKHSDLALLNAAIFHFNGKIWTIRGMSSLQTVYLTEEKLRKLFKLFGFSKLSFYGTEDWGDLFKEDLNPSRHHWINLIARR